MSKALYGLIRQSKTGTSVVPICNIKSFFSSRALVCCSSDTLIGISPSNNTTDIAISAAKNIRRFGIDREPHSLAFPIANLITNFIRIYAKASARSPFFTLFTHDGAAWHGIKIYCLNLPRQCDLMNRFRWAIEWSRSTLLTCAFTSFNEAAIINVSINSFCCLMRCSLCIQCRHFCNRISNHHLNIYKQLCLP